MKRKLGFKLTCVVIAMIMILLNVKISFAEGNGNISINLSNLTYTENGSEKEITKYTQDEFDKFLADYNAGTLPGVYVTEFLFDGVGMYAPYDLDDFIDEGNDYVVEPYKKTVVNINTTGTINLSGTLSGGMIAINTNGKTSAIDLVLNGVKIDTKDSNDKGKKCPAIYVYNKDTTYTSCKVTIKTAEGTKNYIEGGKFKKVSLVGNDEYDNYAKNYSGDAATNYASYSNYYKVYSSDEISKILFAKVQADREDLSDGDPYYFYKGAGAISSDIDLYFQGTGYLEVTSKNKEGIETKGNLTFSGGTGDYVVYAEDDCLNTTTSSSSNQGARNTLTIDVNSLYAIVDGGEDADEGDAIDSNGTLIINGGTIVALAHPGQDAGLDSENGTYINGGTILATGDMYDEISSESKQNFLVLSFQNQVTSGTCVTLLDSNDTAIMSYKTDRTYTKLVYSSDKLVNGDYYVYKDGTVEGEENNGFYTTITKYTKGTMQGYSSTGNSGGMPGGGAPGERQADMPEGAAPGVMQGIGNNRPDGNGSGENGPDGNMNNGGTPPSGEAPEMPNGENQNANERPQMGERPGSGSEMGRGMPQSEDENQRGGPNGANSSGTASNNKFSISGISNIYNGVADYVEGNVSADNGEKKNEREGSSSSESGESGKTAESLPKAGEVAIISSIIIVVSLCAMYFFIREKKIKIK